MDWNAVKPLLDAKLNPDHVKKGGGNFGPKGDYIEGWHAIAEANRIFGHGGWSYTIDLRQDDLREATTPKGPQWQAAYTCVCRLTVDGVVREDVGFGSGFAKSIGDAIEGATKEAATDALKRCLRTFGNPFGLALYDKTRENVGHEPPPPKAPEPAKVFGWLIGKVGMVATEDAWTDLMRNPKWDEGMALLKQAAPDLHDKAQAAADDRFRIVREPVAMPGGLEGVM